MYQHSYCCAHSERCIKPTHTHQYKHTHYKQFVLCFDFMCVSIPFWFNALEIPYIGFTGQFTVWLKHCVYLCRWFACIPFLGHNSMQFNSKIQSRKKTTTPSSHSSVSLLFDFFSRSSSFSVDMCSLMDENHSFFGYKTNASNKNSSNDFFFACSFALAINYIELAICDG